MAMIKFLPRRALCGGLVVMGLSVTAVAVASSASLGQAWPNAQDVSASSHWHVYVFANDGVRYFQVNDLYGNVRVAFATANGQFLVLPMGRDAQRISTPQQTAATSTTAVPLTLYTETVYRDSDIRLTAVPLSDGTTTFTVDPAITTTTSTTPSPCDDPEQCSSHSP